MRKFYAALMVLGLLAGTAVIYAVRNWDPYRNIPQVSLNRLNQSEANWYAQGILDYDARISVAFSSELRQYEVVVRSGVFSEARSSRWEEALEAWGPFSPTPAEEAGFITMPGIFSTVRSALFNESVPREVLRMEIDAALAFPKRVILGRIFEDGLPVDGTEVLIEVVEFEIR